MNPAPGIGFVSNGLLAPAINWSTLGPPVERAFVARGADVLHPTPSLMRTLTPGRGSEIRRARASQHLFWMQLSARPESTIAATVLGAPGTPRSMYVLDPWPYVLPRIAKVVKALRISHCFVSFAEAYEALRDRYPSLPFHHLPFGVDTETFAGDARADRDIFAFWMGRRHAPLFDALESYCAQRGLRFEASQNGAIRDPAELGRLVARSRYFVVTPPDLDHPDRAGGFSPFVMRYLEGIAAGARLLGVEPRSGEFSTMLPADCMVSVRPDGSDLADRLDQDTGDETTVWRIAAAQEHVRAHHSWAARVDTVISRLKDAG